MLSVICAQSHLMLSVANKPLMLSVVMLNVVMVSVVCRCAECCYAKGPGAPSFSSQGLQPKGRLVALPAD